MELKLNAITEYFSGEKMQCLVGIAISAVSIALALYFLLQLKTDLYKGVAWPFLIISVLLLSICVGVVWRTAGDIERVSNYVQNEPEKIKTDEIPRMENVMRNFKVIKVVELSLLAVGIFLAMFGASKGAMQLTGIGIGLGIQSAIMYGFDYFAHKRADVYFEFLQNL